jgi:hypothetical protein
MSALSKCIGNQHLVTLAGNYERLLAGFTANLSTGGMLIGSERIRNFYTNFFKLIELHELFLCIKFENWREYEALACRAGYSRPL